MVILHFNQRNLPGIFEVFHSSIMNEVLFLEKSISQLILKKKQDMSKLKILINSKVINTFLNPSIVSNLGT